MKRVIKNFFCCVLLLSFLSVTPAKPVSETTAQVGSFSGGVVTGVLTGVATYWFLHKHLQWQEQNALAVAVLSGLGVGVATWYFAYLWLHSETPDGRIDFAERVLKDVGKNGLVSQQQSDDAFLQYVNASSPDKYPLSDARRKLDAMENDLMNAKQGIRAAEKENPAARDSCEKIENNLNELLKEVRRKRGIVGSDPDYLWQAHADATARSVRTASQTADDLRRWGDDLRYPTTFKYKQQTLDRDIPLTKQVPPKFTFPTASGIFARKN